MIQFSGGPADDSVLDLRRIPLWLRVVIDEAGEVDALDQLEDTVRDGETAYVYRRVGEVTRAIACSRSKGCMPWLSAKYEYVEGQPEQSILRDNEQWQAWAVEVGVVS